MPDFTAANVQQNLRATRSECFGQDEGGGWWAVQAGAYPVAEAPAWSRLWWASGRVANTLRLDVTLENFEQGDAVELELWAQQEDRAGGGVRVWQGTLTIPAPAPQTQINGSWYLVGCCTGPRSEAWGLRARITAGFDGTQKVRARLVGDVCACTPGTIVRGEFVT